ncbi:hypothetical protein M1446_04640 [Candidatus Dependentiae bacterium]|nr:hypothetical protein [Candidatus Dependentiae bacterium]
MDLNYLISYFKRQIFLGLIIGMIIPIFVYRAAILIAPRPDITQTPEYEQIRKLQKKIEKLGLQINFLKVLAKDKQEKKHLEDLKLEKKQLKKELFKQTEEITNKIGQSQAWYEKSLFYLSLLAGLAAFFYGTATKIVPLSIGFILGGLYCIFMAHYTYWERFNDLIKFLSILIIFFILVFLAYRYSQDLKTKD